MDLTTPAIAARLGVSVPTVRKILESGEITAHKRSRGSRYWWIVDSDVLDIYLRRYPGRTARPRRGVPALSDVVNELKAIREELRALRSDIDESTALPDARQLPVQDDRLDREIVLAQRAITDAVLQADEARSEVIRLLTRALEVSETADGYRRAAQRASESLMSSYLIEPPNRVDR